MQKQKLLKKLLSGSKNIRFNEIVNCAKAFGFRLNRVSGIVRSPKGLIRPTRR